ncbi:DUF6538 domain-containing protein [Geobacter sp. FeAm09]|uniref:DUF6538 domain-containing protein n=1 Tax=Geobacter sp. FeAm09 TaxID=2597769 RepID=UPI00143D8917|nr:DUF6538 domain-containing protein [Geobacter sp. FeAm09]
MRKQGDIFYYRRRVPKDLQPLFGVAEFTKTLKTASAKEARAAKTNYDAEIDRIITGLRLRFIDAATARGTIEQLLFAKPFKPQAQAVDLETLPTSPKPKTITQVVDEYEAANKNKWSPKSASEYRTIFSKIKDKFGKMPAPALSAVVVTNWRNELAETLGVSTVNKSMSILSSVMKLAVKRQYVSLNVAEGLLLVDRRKENEIKRPYTDAEMKQILDTLFDQRLNMAGLTAAEAADFTPGYLDGGAVWHLRPTARPERYWVPIISAFTGMRLDEICQLYTDDVQAACCGDDPDKDMLLYFDVNDDRDKKLKNKTSKRLIPFHPALTYLGFDEYCQMARERQQERLFPNLKRTDTGYSNAVQKWYSRWNREHITEDETKTFHSLRHVFADRLKQSDVGESLISEILGHHVSNISMRRYSKEYSLRVRYEAIKQVQYETKMVVYKSLVGRDYDVVKSSEIV